METIHRLLQPYREGSNAAFVTGRSLLDLDLDAEGRIRPLLATLAHRAHAECGMALVRFNLALGLTPELHPFDAEGQRQLERDFAAAGAGALIEPGHGRLLHERALEILRAAHTAVREGRRLPPLLVLFEFADDLMPAEGACALSLQLAEFTVLLGSDTVLRGQPLYLVFCGAEEKTDARVTRSLPRVHLPMPGREDKRVFLDALLTSKLRGGAALEKGLDAATAANLSSHTPNSGLEKLVLASARTGRPVTHERLVEQKRRDVLRESLGTLAALDTARVRGVSLAGRSVARPLALLRHWAAMLKSGHALTPPNIILAGAASTGKTDLALLAAECSGLPTYQLLSPKGGIVGQTECQARTQMRVLRDLSPCLGFIDEITESFPMRRGEMNLDAGASAAVTAELLNALSDRTREGRSMLVATTNRPWAIDPALASRFIFLPVLAPWAEDYPQIIVSLLRSLRPDASARAEEAAVRRAAAVFFEKGLSPRVIRAVLLGTLADADAPADGALLLEAARSACEAEPTDRASAEYADLWALRYTTRYNFLPWEHDGPSAPAALRGIVRADGTLDRQALSARLEELRPHAKL